MNKTIAEKLQNIRFKDLFDCDFAIIFNLISEQERIRNIKQVSSYKGNSIELIKIIISTVRELLFHKYLYHKNSKGKGNHLFLLLPDNVRNDIFDMMNDLYQTTNNSTFVYFTKKTSISINALLLLPTIIDWLSALKSKGFMAYEKVLIIFHLIKIYKFQKNIQKDDISLYNDLTVYYDAHIYNNYFVQHFKRLKIKTITLQHGIMLSKIKELENNIDYAGVEFKGFISDYFLIWNKFTYEQAVQAGINSKQLKILGVIKCIGFQSKEKSIGTNRKFGLILDGINTDFNNIKMIQLANQIATYLNYKYIIRFHPSYSKHEFDNEINTNVAEICDSHISLLDYADLIDFAIISNSTALIELAYIKCPIYRYSSQDITDKYRNLNYPSMNSLNEFIEEYNKNVMIKTKILFNELCGNINDIQHSYKSFYEEL